MKTLLSFLIAALSTAYATDVRSFGAIGNGSSDDTLAVQNAINSCPVNGTINFSAGNYLVQGLRLKAMCTYIGVSGSTITLAAQNRFIFDMSELSGIRITGLTLDGNSRGGAILAQGFAPVTNIQIDHNQFRNVVSSAYFPANITIVSTWGFVNSTIQNNRFQNIATGMWLSTVENVAVLNNSFVDVTQGDAIYIAPNPVSFPSGDNLRIAGNTGSNLARIAIEIFRPDPSNGSILTAPIIENNSFSGWTGSGGMGLSITHGDGAIIRGNHISNIGGPLQLNGIEVIVANAQVSSNVVSGGFAYGIAVQGTMAPSITSNTIKDMSESAIILACSPGFGRCASRNASIANNTIHNPRVSGIKLDNDWTGSLITRNTIVRTGGVWPGDSGGLWFSGVHQSPAPGPGTIDANTVIQDAVSPPAGFWFCGVRVNSQMPGSAITNNVVRSQSLNPFGSGLIDNTGSALQGWVISGNQYINVYHAVN